jgi:hypothetical protein
MRSAEGTEMPAYNSIVPPYSIFTGDTYQLFNAEQPTPGNGGVSASQQVALSPARADGPTPFSVDGKFSGAPGVFEVDIQAAAVDADANYQTVQGGNITAVDATNNTFHFDAQATTAKFVRALVRTRTNAVCLTLNITL